MAADPPEAKPTVQIPQQEIMNARLQQIIDGQAAQQLATELGFKRLGADVAVVASSVDVVKDRVHVLETWKVEQDARSTRTSARVTQASESDLAQAAQLAQERGAREALAVKVEDVVTTLKAQSDFMGMGKRGLTWLASKEGRTAVAQALAAIVFLYEGLKHAGVVK